MCYTFRILKQYLDQNALLSVYYATFYTVLRYGIVFWGWGGCGGSLLSLQKSVVRQMLKLDIKATSRGQFQRLHVLTLPAIYVFESLLFPHKHFNDFNCYFPQHNRNIRADMIYPEHRLCLTEGSSIYVIIKFYNNLPQQVKSQIKQSF